MAKLFYGAVFLLLSTLSFAQPTWHIVSEHFPPYISATNNGNSWLVDITQAALASQKIQSEIEITTWVRALQLARKRKRTAVLGAYYSEQRSKVFYYSSPLGVAKTGFFKRTDHKIAFDGTLNSIKAHSICVGSDYVVSDEFANNHELAVTISKDLQTCLKLLYKGRVELVAGTYQLQVSFGWKTYPNLTSLLSIKLNIYNPI
ncbi:transporter substrate-binding domain-containing protein [Paraglaciecola aquimarina]|uniref:Transporter substrate-binding domain-containing protein n=1 Tax=Paraglaciecola aquimarina TaxID=1235557 RepID=A0ABU3SUB4_9ALTE|nr:transporter substrate-binding domain-containing protein [Paraglaciecola aquimarina]MDU0353608.1 transporter substrate-binding domain-containing protein [Paraglaciecola aquimarina]